MSNERPWKRPREDDLAPSFKRKVFDSLRQPTPPSMDVDDYTAECVGTE